MGAAFQGQITQCEELPTLAGSNDAQGADKWSKVRDVEATRGPQVMNITRKPPLPNKCPPFIRPLPLRSAPGLCQARDPSPSFHLPCQTGCVRRHRCSAHQPHGDVWTIGAPPHHARLEKIPACRCIVLAATEALLLGQPDMHYRHALQVYVLLLVMLDQTMCRARETSIRISTLEVTSART